MGKANTIQTPSYKEKILAIPSLQNTNPHHEKR